jgi:transposase
LYGRLSAGDKVALEAGNLAFMIAGEIIKQVGCEGVVLNAGKLARIVAQFHDDQLPSVPLPTEQEMRRRKLIRSYERVKGLRTKEINTLHGLFVHQGITMLTKKDMATVASLVEAALAS